MGAGFMPYSDELPVWTNRSNPASAHAARRWNVPARFVPKIVASSICPGWPPHDAQ